MVWFLMTIGLLIGAADTNAFGAGSLVDASGAGTPVADRSKWSVETSLTFPMARIYMVKAGYRISDRSELGIGAAFQNWKNEDQDPLGQSNAWTVILSYRHYLWRNLNVEVELWPAYNLFESFVDGRTYKGFEMWVEYKAGYRFDLTRNLSLNLQPGLGHAVWVQHQWPGLEDKSRREFQRSSIIFVPQALISWRF